MRRSAITLATLLILLVLSFVLFGDQLEAWITGPAGLNQLRDQKDWAWLVAIVLLVGDIVLPIPTSAVLAALGVIYGTWLGGVIGSIGCFLAGTCAYWLCRALGERGASALLGEEDVDRAKTFFGRHGMLWIAASRWLPILPEMLSCMAGLSGMSWTKFALATACGSVPLGFAWAGLGSLGRETPIWPLVVSALVPVLLWLVVLRRLRRQ